MDGGWGLIDQRLDCRRAAEAAPGRKRVGRVLLRRIAGLERRGQAALGPVAGALGEGSARDQADAPSMLGRLQRCPQTGCAATDDSDVELRVGGYRCPASRRIAST